MTQDPDPGCPDGPKCESCSFSCLLGGPQRSLVLTFFPRGRTRLYQVLTLWVTDNDPGTD